MDKPERFGTLSTGEVVHRHTLSNRHGMKVSVISLGAIITEICVPDCDGEMADVVTGFHDAASYEANHPFFGAVIGRIAGRLSGGRLDIDGCSYQLEINDPPNHLHGGAAGFHTRLWETVRRENNLVEFGYTSPDGENGYPGTVSARVGYGLTEDNTLEIVYSATTDRATPLSLTNHAWFNLAGEGRPTILDHELQIHADVYTPTDAAMTLLGTVAPVQGTAADFRQPRLLRDAVPGLLNEHGDNYLFPGASKNACRPVARLVHPPSGRVLDVSTTERCLQFYAGKALDGTWTGKSARTYGSFGALCLECQGYPDGPNHPEIEDIILRPGQTYRQTTRYAFSTVRRNQTPKKEPS